MAEEKNIEVPASDDGQRLDRWLKRYMPYGLVQKLVRKGAIRVDGVKAKKDMRIAAGQIVRIPPIEDSKPKRDRVILNQDDKIFIRSRVIYDDGDVVVIDKPEGLASQGGEGISRHVDYYLPGLKQGDLIPKLIHRLDRETSGVMILARKPDTIRDLGKIFKYRKVRKIYWALTHPSPDEDAGCVRAGIAKGPRRERMVIDDEDGKPSQTEFSVLEKASKHAAFVAFWPRTGRTHQIRIHAADILMAPVIGDDRYDAPAFEGGLALANRLHLHARRLILDLPSGKRLDISAPLPDDLKESWKALEFDPEREDDPFDLPDLDCFGYSCSTKG